MRECFDHLVRRWDQRARVGGVDCPLGVHHAAAKAQRKVGSFGTLRLSTMAPKLHELTDAERAAPLA